MTTEEMRIAIAEHLGWTQAQDDDDPTWWTHSPKSKYVYGDMEKYWPLHVIPDYLNDLNAMHDAAITLRYPKTQSLWKKNEVELAKIITRDNNIYSDSVSFNWECQNATAAQRAEAFLRTINKYTP